MRGEEGGTEGGRDRGTDEGSQGLGGRRAGGIKGVGEGGRRKRRNGMEKVQSQAEMKDRKKEVKS